jgi:hypothetical protein
MDWRDEPLTVFTSTNCNEQSSLLKISEIIDNAVPLKFFDCQITPMLIVEIAFSPSLLN